LIPPALGRPLEYVDEVAMTASRGSWDGSWTSPPGTPTQPGGSAVEVRFRPAAGGGGADGEGPCRSQADKERCFESAVASISAMGIPGLTHLPSLALGPCLSPREAGGAAWPVGADGATCGHVYIGRVALTSNLLRSAADATPCGRSAGVGQLITADAVTRRAQFASLRVSAAALGGGRREAVVELVAVFPDAEGDVLAGLSEPYATQAEVARDHLRWLTGLYVQREVSHHFDNAELLGCPAVGGSTLRAHIACRGAAATRWWGYRPQHLGCSSLAVDAPLFVGKESLAGGSQAAVGDRVALRGGLRASQYLSADGPAYATLALDVVAADAFVAGTSACVRQVLPWNLNPRLSTVRFAVGDGGGDRAEWDAASLLLAVAQRDEDPAGGPGGGAAPWVGVYRANTDAREGSHTVALCTGSADLGGVTTLRLSFEVEKLHMGSEETPADLARGYEVPPARVVVGDGGTVGPAPRFVTMPDGPATGASGRVPHLEARSNMLLVTAPYGDYSMLFNVPVLSSLVTMVVVSMVLGGLAERYGDSRARGSGSPQKQAGGLVRKAALGLILTACLFIVVYESDDVQALLGIQHLFA